MPDYRALSSSGLLSLVSRTIPTAVTQKPAIRLGHALLAGWLEAMRNAATARRTPATIHNQATARMRSAKASDDAGRKLATAAVASGYVLEPLLHLGYELRILHIAPPLSVLRTSGLPG